MDSAIWRKVWKRNLLRTEPSEREFLRFHQRFEVNFLNCLFYGNYSSVTQIIHFSLCQFLIIIYSFERFSRRFGFWECKFLSRLACETWRQWNIWFEKFNIISDGTFWYKLCSFYSFSFFFFVIWKGYWQRFRIIICVNILLW